MANVSVNFHLEKCGQDIRCYTNTDYISVSLGYHPKELCLYLDLNGATTLIKRLTKVVKELKENLKEVKQP